MDELEKLKDNIEMMDKQHQIEILRILKNDKLVSLNENVNGVFINLTDVSDRTINFIKKYIVYVDKQNNNIIQIENKKDEIEKTYFTSSKSLLNKNKMEYDNSINISEDDVSVS
jgi:hypothetical protein